jgi:sarcosine oxidase
MEPVDTVVVGLGVMGAAALDAIAARGGSVIGIERFTVPNRFGSSHGDTRVIRKAYSEDPAYVPLLHEAWRAWEELERSADERLLTRTGALHFGRRDHAGVAAVRRSVREHGLAVEELDAAAIARRFPALRPGPDDVGLLELDGGFLAAERCVTALVRRAQARGARIRTGERVLAIEVGAGAVSVRTDRGEIVAGQAVLTQGAWSEGDASVLPIPVPLRIERQVQLWFRPRAPELFAPERMPVFIHFGPFEHLGRAGDFYGIPARGAGVKVCRHHGGATTRAEHVDRDVHPDDEAPVRAYLRAHLPAADGERVDARVCMYANTPDGHFAVGPHPAHPARVAIACGFSGHGFKLAPVVGRLVVEHLGGAPALPLFDPLRPLDPLQPA